jgi:transposase-like protein
MRKMETRGSGVRPADWDDAKKSELIRRIVDGKLGVAAACRRHGLAQGLLVDWLRAFRRSTLLALDERLKQRLLVQGVPSESFGGAEICASLTELSVADVVQIIGLSDKSAVITLTHAGRESHLWCCSGVLVDAESGRLRGEAAVYRILSLEQGQILAELRPSERARSIHASTSALLLEAARRKDESVALREQLGDPERRYEAAQGAHALGASELRALQLFQPACSWREALERSELGDFETLSALCRLLAQEWLVPAAPLEPAAPLQTLTTSSSLTPWRAEPPTSWRWALNAVGAHVLLPAASWLGAKLAARDAQRGGAALNDY